MSFTQIKERKLAQLRESLKAAALALSPPTHDEEIYLNASAVTICKKIKAQEWKTIEVVTAFARQALKENERLNFITECFIAEALEQAKGKPVAPLYGLPISIKDLFDMEGVDTSVGMSKRCEKPAEKDAAIVAILRRAGAIVLFKTNVPQTLNTNESSNPIFGTTCNPDNLAYTCGGSSGGEAAAIMSKSAALGIGSDIAGSLRYPVHFSGGYSLKPSEGRWPRLGSFDIDRLYESPCINAVTGPMTRNYEDLKFISQLVMDSAPWDMDATCLRLPWTVQKEKKYHFAYYIDNTYTLPSPACARAVQETVNKLRAKGYTCTEIVPPKMAETAKCFVALTSMDGNKSMRKLIENDPWEKNVTMSMYVPRLPAWFRKAAAYLVGNLFNDLQWPALLSVIGHKSIEELCMYTAQRRDLKQYWLDRVWSKGYDGIICPVYPLPAVKHTATTEILPIAITTYIFNLLDYSVGTLPVTKVRPEDDHRNLPQYSGWHGIFHKIIYEGLFGAPAVYNAAEMSGLNVAVQIVGKQFEEEKVLEMMAVVDNLK